MAESLFIRFAAVYIARESALYVYGYKQHFLVRILPGVLYNIIVSAVFFAISLLIAVLARPKPLIKYRRGKDKVIDNA